MSLRPSSCQRGFTLLEIMIAVLVLGVGLLGLAHLQLTSLKHNQSAEFRSQASILATDMLDRMRANIIAARDGEYALAMNADPPETVDTVSKADITNWFAIIAERLPQGDGAIGCTAYNPDAVFVCDITVSWTEVQDSGDLGTTSFAYSSAL